MHCSEVAAGCLVCVSIELWKQALGTDPKSLCAVNRLCNSRHNAD